MIGFTKEILKHLCIDLNKTDIEIAEFFDIDRTTIVHQRKKHGIKKYPNIGRTGEIFAIKQLRKRGFAVKDLNEEDGTSQYDLLVNEKIRIEVKTSSISSSNGGYYFTFSLTEKPESGCKESKYRIKLKNGRLRKLYRNTCDYFILVGIADKKAITYIIPSNFINDNMQTIKIPVSIDSSSDYHQFKNRWGLLNKKMPDAPTSDTNVI